MPPGAFKSLNMPTTLYRYSGLAGDRQAWMEALVVSSKCFFSKASSFNDPLDCRLPPTFDAPEAVIESYWRSVAQRQVPKDPPDVMKARILQLIHDSKTADGQAKLAEGFCKSLDTNGIACFAKSLTSMLHWSYYADGHSGIAVRFDVSPKTLAQLPGLFFPVEVKYSKLFPETNYYEGMKGDAVADFLRVALGTKSYEWAHEEEWRIVLPNVTGVVQLPPGMVNGVVLGLRTTAESEARVREWIKQSRRGVELLRVVHKPKSFELELKPA